VQTLHVEVCGWEKSKSLDKRRLTSECSVHRVLSIVQTADMACRSAGMAPVGKESAKRTSAQYVYRKAKTGVVADVNAEG
jgi:hypothetical protein